ncbi:MAG TPA: hypothetical protein VEF04_03045 [Blastocatellia bacterium]|nr:hypothetical protein [Blastocatellia bacterium]
MKKILMLIVALLVLTANIYAQDQVSTKGAAQNSTQTSAQSNQKSVTLDAGTKISAELLSSIDASKVRPGDEFKLRTIKPIMVNGKQVVKKGATLIGRVAEVTVAEGKQSVSHIKMTFDQLRNQNLTIPFSATLEQITQVSLNNQSSLNDVDATMQGSGSARSQTSASSGGGLLGGATGVVGGAVGTVANTTTNTVGTVGGVVNSTGQQAGRVIATTSRSAGQTAAGASQIPGLIEISSETSGEATASSTLSLAGRNVRIDKGAVFTLRTDKQINLSGTN